MSVHFLFHHPIFRRLCLLDVFLQLLQVVFCPFYCQSNERIFLSLIQKADLLLTNVLVDRLNFIIVGKIKYFPHNMTLLISKKPDPLEPGPLHHSTLVSYCRKRIVYLTAAEAFIVQLLSETFS